MTRVVAMFSDRRAIVAIRRMVGKDENSSGFLIHSATIRISTDSAIEKARPMSIRKGGIGRNSTQRMTTMPSAKPISLILGAALGRGIAGGCAISPVPSLHEKGLAATPPAYFIRLLSGEACARMAAGVPAGPSLDRFRFSSKH